MRFKAVVFGLSLTLAASLAPQASFAGTFPPGSVAGSLKLTSTNGQVYPYVFDVTIGSTTTTGVDLSCLNDNRSVSVGESWNVEAVNLDSLIIDGVSSVDGSSLTGLEEDAYLDALYNTGHGTDTEVQDAIWDILNPGSKSLDSTATADYNNAIASIGHESTSFYSQFTFYFPSTDNGQTSEPQEFMGYSPVSGNGVPPVTPEPSSLILLGTGILGLAGGLRHRMSASKA
jgi:hypothetical protein